jgi:hypothetical protein
LVHQITRSTNTQICMLEAYLVGSIRDECQRSRALVNGEACFWFSNTMMSNSKLYVLWIHRAIQGGTPLLRLDCLSYYVIMPHSPQIIQCCCQVSLHLSMLWTNDNWLTFIVQLAALWVPHLQRDDEVSSTSSICAQPCPSYIVVKIFHQSPLFAQTRACPLPLCSLGMFVCLLPLPARIQG